MELAFALTRLGQLVGAMVLSGSALFFLYGMRGRAAGWQAALMVGASLLGAVSTLGWLMAQAAYFSDAARAAFDPAAVWSVTADTGFGRAAGVRLLLFAAALPVLAVVRGSARSAVAAALGTAAAASFAWTGHGAVDEGLAGTVHLGADIVHLVAAAAWIGALVPLVVLMLRCGSPAELDAANLGLARFSGIGPAVVALLVLTGLVNSWFLVGLGQVAALPGSLYGRLLILKLAAFAAMLGLAAANRFVLSPRLARGPDGAPALRISVIAETLLAVLVLAAVAWLGTLAPPISGE